MTRRDNDPHAAASAEEQRALDAGEQQMADMARHPALEQVRIASCPT